MHAHTGDAGGVTVILLLPFATALVLYVGGVLGERRRRRRWPWHRTVLFAAGIAAAAAAVVAPAEAGGFAGHMVLHLLAAMLAPLLLVLAAPVTLALRALHVSRARRLARLLRSAPLRVVSHPVTAAVLAVGGMWLIYATPLFALSQRSLVVHLLVMGHMLLAGYLFTASLISLDPSPHRSGFGMRIGVLVVALAAHAVLAKLLYADGLAGVALDDVRSGAMLMYYAGDVVDAAIALVLCAQWYRASGRRLTAVITATG